MVEWIQIMTEYSAPVWDSSCHNATTATSEPTVDYVKMSDILLFKDNDDIIDAKWINVDGKLQSPRKGHAVSIIRRSQMASVCVRWNQGTIKSPNYPNHYPRNVYQVTLFTLMSFFLYIIFKEWPLEVAEGRRIQLTFTSFNIEYHHRCLYDYVEVSSGTFKEKYCGPNPNGFYYNGNGDNIGTPIPSVTSVGKTMKVRFYSDSHVARTGFKADWHEF